ncbi:MAG: methyltransferase [Sphingomicrobium sp.]
MRIHAILGSIALAAAPLAANAAPAPLADVVAAVKLPARGADNVKLDASRKPAEILRWAGLRSGMRTLDLFGGNLYWAEIMAPAVGPKGSVTVWEPAQFIDDKGKAAFATFATAAGNVDLRVSPMEAPDLPARAFDFAMLNLNYHDVYWENAKFKIPRMDPAAWLKTLNAAMKRGSTVVVIDHVAKTGAPRETVEKYHRIDPAVVRADFRKAGFALVGSSALLSNPKDDYAIGVFDKKVQGKTDRVVYKFRKVR